MGESRIGRIRRRTVEDWKIILGSTVRLPPVTIAVAIGLLGTAFLLPFFTKFFVDRFLVADQSDWLVPLALGMVATAVLRSGLTWWQRSILLRVQVVRSKRNSRDVFQHMLSASRDHLQRYTAGDIASILRGQDKAARVIYGDVVHSIIELPAVPLLFIVMAAFDATIATAAVALTLGNAIALRAIARKRAGISERLAAARGALAGTLTRYLRVMPAIKAGTLEETVFADWDRGHRDQTENLAQLGRLSERLSLIPGLVGGLSLSVILGIGALAIMRGSMSVGDLVACQALFFSINDPIRRFIEASGQLQDVNADFRRRHTIKAMPRDPWLADRDPAPAEDGARPQAFHRSALVLRDLDFGQRRFEAGSSATVSVTLERGRCLAVVGRSGSGKTALARVIAGLDPPSGGDVLVGGHSVAGLSQAQLPGAVAMVSHELTLFDGPIRDSLTLWNPEIPEEAVWRACATACIDSVIAATPGGLDTVLGPGGIGLSGGQMQRLNLARALVRDPGVVVLDEALEALDPVLARAILRRLSDRGCATVLVTHRQEILRICDQVLSLDNERPTASDAAGGPDRQGPYPDG